MCPICNVTDDGRHHYDCPYDEGNESRTVTWNATLDETKGKYANNN